VDYNLYPKREHQLKWITVYLEEAARLRGTCMHDTLNVEITEMPIQKDCQFYLFDPTKKLLKAELHQFNHKNVSQIQSFAPKNLPKYV